MARDSRFLARRLNEKLVFLLLIHVLALSSAFAESENSSDSNFVPPPVSFQRLATPRIDDATRARWRQVYFEGAEVWFFRSREEYFFLLEYSELRDGARGSLSASFRTQPTEEEWRSSIGWFPGPREAQGFLLVPESLRDEMPNRFLQMVYEYQLALTGRFPHDRIDGATPADIIETFRFAGSTAREADIRRNIVRLGGRWTFPVVPANWSLLPTRLRDEVMDRGVRGRFTEGLDLVITLAPGTDLEAVARYYAGQRDPEPLIRYLRILRNRQPAGDLVVPLASILHPFIRDQVGTYSDCHGPNCFNVGRNIGLTHSYVLEFRPEGESIERELLAGGFQRVPERGARPGDVFIYRNARNEIVHMSVLVSEGFVFTKNGLTKLNPYIFQARAVNEAIFFPHGGFQLTVLRSPPPQTTQIPARAQRLAGCPWAAISL